MKTQQTAKYAGLIGPKRAPRARRNSTADEHPDLLEKFGVEYDPRYIFKPLQDTPPDE
jgi:hypothetical protein